LKLFACVLGISGLALLAFVDWRIAAGLYLYSWGANVAGKCK
jgi:hypothetical protein